MAEQAVPHGAQESGALGGGVSVITLAACFPEGGGTMTQFPWESGLENK